MSIKINIKNISNTNTLPEYATSGSSGLDLRANIDLQINLAPFERKLIPTGIFIEIPLGIEAQIRPRSGLALKKGLTCLNTPGTIDSDYRGEIKVLLINLSNEYQYIENGDRIAQIVFSKIEIINWNLVSEFNIETQRGDGGFGHTGNN